MPTSETVIVRADGMRAKHTAQGPMHGDSPSDAELVPVAS